MSKKAFRPLRIAPLQRVVSETVTDPDEIAAMEEVYKRLKRKQRKQEARNGESVEDRPLRIAPLQRVVAEEVTDPAEIAAMEKLRKRLKREQKKQETTKNGKRVKSSPKTRGKKKKGQDS